MELVAFLGQDKQSWGQVQALINKGDWEKIIVINSTPDSFTANKNIELINIDATKPLTQLKQNLMQGLKGKFTEFEACVSIASGNGKEHMALISALLSLPMGIRLVAYTQKGVEFVN